MLNIYISAKYFTKQFKCNTFPVRGHQDSFYLQFDRAGMAQELPVTPQQLSYNPRLMGAGQTIMGATGQQKFQASQREWGEGKGNYMKLLKKTAWATFAPSGIPKPAAVCIENPDSHSCLLSTHLQTYCCPALVSVSHMKFPYGAYFIGSGTLIRYLIQPGEMSSFECFSVTITAKLLKTAICKYSTRSAAPFQTASIYFLTNVKKQTAFLDMQQEPSLQTNKCDAIDSESNLGGRGKATVSGAHYRLPNSNKFRLVVIVLERETQMEHCSPAGQEEKEGIQRGSNPPCQRQQLWQLVCITTVLLNCLQVTQQPKIHKA